MNKIFSCLLLALILLSVLQPTPVSAGEVPPTVFTVNQTSDKRDLAIDKICDADSHPGEQCTLRAAIDEANACTTATCGASVTINVPAGTYTLTLVGANEDANASGDLDLIGWVSTTIPITIQGAGAGQTIIDGNQLDRVFHAYWSYSNVQIHDLTVRNGYLEQTASYYATGAGILLNHSSGSLRLDHVIIEDNTIVCMPADEPSCYQGKGGGVSSNGSLEIYSSTIRNNDAPGGGGLTNNLSAVTKIYSSTFTGNSASISGGAMYTLGPIEIYNSTISGNSASYTGGIFLYENTMKLINVTISGNQTNDFASNLKTYSGGTMTVINSIIANPLRAGGSPAYNCDNNDSWTSLGNNLSSDDTCLFTAAGDQPNTNPMLTPLMDLGGTTQTHGLLSQSPAHDATSSKCSYDGRPVTVDQRGETRDDQCDLGAFEGVAYNTYMPVIQR